MRFGEGLKQAAEKEPGETKKGSLKELFSTELVGEVKRISEMHGPDAMKEMEKISKDSPEKAEQINAMMDVIEANNPTRSLKELFANPEKIKELMEEMEEKE